MASASGSVMTQMYENNSDDSSEIMVLESVSSLDGSIGPHSNRDYDPKQRKGELMASVVEDEDEESKDTVPDMLTLLKEVDSTDKEKKD